MKSGEFYSNNKNSQIYEILMVAIDATDGDRTGQNVVVYKNEAGFTYVRERTNFMEKFTRIKIQPDQPF